MESNEVTLQSSQPAHATAGVLSPESRELLIKFRQQIHALGALWIMSGAVSILASLYVLFLAEDPTFLNIQSDVMIVLGSVWLVLGVLTCRKEMSALTGALVLSYLAMALSIANGSRVGGFLILAIVQSHRVRDFAKKLTAEGIALTTKP